MLSNIVLLLSASAILCVHLGTTPEELKAVFKIIYGRLEAEHVEADIALRADVVPLGYYTDEARWNVIGNLTEAAQPYWNKLSALQKQAAADGKKISPCVDQGNNKLYALNDSILSGPFDKIQAYFDDGNRIITKSSRASAGVVAAVSKLGARVSKCTNDVCAEELETEATDLFQTGLKTITDSVKVSQEYVLVNLPAKLDQIRIDKDQYRKSYARILDSIKQCIDNL